MVLEPETLLVLIRTRSGTCTIESRRMNRVHKTIKKPGMVLSPNVVKPRRKNNVDKDADLRKAVNSCDRKNILTFLTKVACICKNKKQNK
jgi:hypothetical protein